MKRPEYDSARPWAASYIIVRHEEKIAMLLRGEGWMENFWGVPSGKKEWGESSSQAGIREASEEIGITIAPANLRQVLTICRYEASSDSEWMDTIFEAEHWTGEMYNAEPKAHQKLGLFAPNDLPDNTVPIVRFAIEAIEIGKTYAEYGWS